MRTLALIAGFAVACIASGQEPSKAPEEKAFECTGEYTTGKKGAFREIVLVRGDVARISDIEIPLKPDGNPDYFNYVVNLGGSGRIYQLTLFRKTGRFKYSTFIRKLVVAEGDCKKSEPSNVFE